MGLFSFFSNSSLLSALKKGAVIVDVRTAAEYDRGRVPGSLHIPADRIKISIERLRAMKRPVVCCCSSGHRSRQAVNLLKQAGLKEVYNGGSWEKVLRLLNRL